MSVYRMAIEAAGSKVLEWYEEGDYQGIWAAKVEKDCAVGWIFGSFGTCSGCDEAESEGVYYNSPRLAEFGAGFEVIRGETLLNYLSERERWEPKMVAFVMARL